MTRLLEWIEGPGFGVVCFVLMCGASFAMGLAYEARFW